jgi:hypothetical protein
MCCCFYHVLGAQISMLCFGAFNNIYSPYRADLRIFVENHGIAGTLDGHNWFYSEELKYFVKNLRLPEHPPQLIDFLSYIETSRIMKYR